MRILKLLLAVFKVTIKMPMQRRDTRKYFYVQLAIKKKQAAHLSKNCTVKPTSLLQNHIGKIGLSQQKNNPNSEGRIE